MFWTQAIEINQAALARIVAGLIAMVGLAADGALGRVPRPLYWAVVRVLRPAEAAVRRLVVIAARGLVVKLGPVRPMPKGLRPAGKGGVRVSFPLFDPRKQFGRVRRRYAKRGPRIWSFEAFLLSQPAEEPAASPDDGAADGRRLGLRLAAITQALEDLPRQAQRLMRLKARRSKVQRLRSQSPLRPGAPPGFRQKPREEIDFVLRECHGLAKEALFNDSS